MLSSCDKTAAFAPSRLQKPSFLNWYWLAVSVTTEPLLSPAPSWSLLQRQSSIFICHIKFWAISVRCILKNIEKYSKKYSIKVDKKAYNVHMKATFTTKKECRHRMYVTFLLLLKDWKASSCIVMFVSTELDSGRFTGWYRGRSYSLFLKGRVILQSIQSYLDGKMNLRNPTNPAAL